MAGRFQNPFPQFLDATPTVRAGGKLFFYAAGSSTKLNTYSDKGLTSPNTNPIILNSAGYPSVQIWLQDVDYKVVLAPSTDTDPPSAPVWSSDNERARDSALIAKSLNGSGSPNGSVAGTQGSASILADQYWDYTNNILYFCTTTGNAAGAVWTAVNASTAASVVPPPQGYLTLTSGTPVITGDVTAATSIYYTPYVGNLVPIYNGSSFAPTTFTEQTLSLVASHVASNIYDVFVFNNSGVPTVVTGPSWSAGTSGSITAGSCARGTGAGGTTLTRLSGILVNNVQITGRNGSTTYTIAANLATYLGSIFMDGSNGQISNYVSYGQSRKWGVWNAYNRVPIVLRAGDSTASWSYNTATIRAANGSSANSFSTFTGLPEESALLQYVNAVSILANTASAGIIEATVGIGLNSITAYTGKNGTTGIRDGNTEVAYGKTDAYAEHLLLPTIGINTITALEKGSGSAGKTTTFFGTNATQMLRASYRG